MKFAVVLFNLGGPDSPRAVEPFLRNLFGDPAILSVPALVRLPLAWALAKRRAPVAREIYARLGGKSPILANTLDQAKALEAALGRRGKSAKCFVAMRCWHPYSDETAGEVKSYGPDRIILLPLYPQFSTTTTASSFADWDRAAKRAGVTGSTSKICCYSQQPGFVAATGDLLKRALAGCRDGVDYRVLFSAHGLPERTIESGDPYQWQVERSASAVVERLGLQGLDWRVTYQSRVGPLKWIGPATDTEIRRAGAEGKGLIVLPIAFVSEHSETLVELDLEYRDLAQKVGVPDYIRVPTVGTSGPFVEGLADMVEQAAAVAGTASSEGSEVCPGQFAKCLCKNMMGGGVG